MVRERDVFIDLSDLPKYEKGDQKTTKKRRQEYQKKYQSEYQKTGKKIQIRVSEIEYGHLSEVAKKNDALGGFISAMPLVTLFVLFWMYFEGVPEKKIGNHATFTLAYEILTLPMFLIIPFLLRKTGFYGAILLSISTTLAFA